MRSSFNYNNLNKCNNCNFILEEQIFKYKNKYIKTKYCNKCYMYFTDDKYLEKILKITITKL